MDYASNTVLAVVKKLPQPTPARHVPHKQASMTDLQIKVLCILKHEDEYPTESLLYIKDHCDLLNIPFYTRAYDSMKFSEDRKYIQKLPAFHIFVKGLHKDTFYTDSAPKLKIRSVYDKYKAKAAKPKKTWSILRLFTFPLFASKKPLKVADWK